MRGVIGVDPEGDDMEGDHADVRGTPPPEAELTGLPDLGL